MVVIVFGIKTFTVDTNVLGTFVQFVARLSSATGITLHIRAIFSVVEFCVAASKRAGLAPKLIGLFSHCEGFCGGWKIDMS